MVKTLLIFGCGYTCQFLGRSLVAEGWNVIGTTRSRENAKKLLSAGIKPVLWDEEDKIKDTIVSGCSVLNSIAPNFNGDVVLDRFDDLMFNGNGRLNWLGFLSTTGVYGNRFGDWVDEESFTDTATLKGKLRLKAEDSWKNFSLKYKIPLYVFRIGGIYGPERNVFDRIKSGNVKKVNKKDQYFNRIHVEDIVGAVSKALEHPEREGTYNLCDDLPSKGGDVFDEATRLLNIPLLKDIEFEDADLSEAAKAFYLESKKVSNKKLKEKLGYSLKFPTYKMGLKAIFENKTNSN